MKPSHLYTNLVALTLCALLEILARAQMAPVPPLQDPLLEHMVGDWTLTGTIMDKTTTHRVHVEWILQHHILHLTEVSDEKNPDGGAQYQSDVEIGWNSKRKNYDCLWLDNYGTSIVPMYIGHGEARPNEIPFVFHYGSTIFHTDFSYLPDGDKWTWKMDSEESGKVTPFARVTLTRAK